MDIKNHHYSGCLEYDEIDIFVEKYIKDNNLPIDTQWTNIVKTMFDSYNPDSYGKALEC